MDIAALRESLVGLPRGIAADVEAEDLLAILDYLTNSLRRAEHQRDAMIAAAKESLRLSGHPGLDADTHDSELVLAATISGIEASNGLYAAKESYVSVDYRLPDGSVVAIPFDGPSDSRHGRTLVFQMAGGAVVEAVRVER